MLHDHSTESKAWEVDCCRGHTNNVSSALFSSRLDIIVSNSEDKTLRIWDINKRTPIHVYKKDERFWTLIQHPTLNIFGAGHDAGFLVFKLQRERCAMTTHENLIYYIKNKVLRVHNVATKTDVPCLQSLKPITTLQMNSAPKSLSFNVSENAILVYNVWIRSRILIDP